jgi:hypothetical protein
MTSPKASPAPSLLYSGTPAVRWVRTLTEFIDESLAALCARQWQRAPIAVLPCSKPQSKIRRDRW